MERKGFGIRFGAVFIDGIIIAIAYLILNMIFGVKFAPAEYTTMDAALAGAGKSVTRTYLLYGILGLAMGAVEVLLAQTPGKMLLKMNIGSAAGGPASRQQLIKRAALKYGPYVFYLLSGITGILLLSYIGAVVALVYVGGCFAALGQTRQALHDIVGSTAVYGPAKAPVQGFQPVMQGSTTPPPPAV